MIELWVQSDQSIQIKTHEDSVSRHDLGYSLENLKNICRLSKPRVDVPKRQSREHKKNTHGMPYPINFRIGFLGTTMKRYG
jgi:hypothetical protein